MLGYDESLGGDIPTLSSNVLCSVERVKTTTTASVKRYQRLAVSPAGFFLFLAMAVVAWNAVQVDPQQYVLAANPDSTEGDTRLDGKALTAARDGYLTPSGNDHPFVTEATKLEQTYTVQAGDTITGIADKFGLHVATIAERNELTPASLESLHPGASLAIPAEDTSDSKEWLLALNAQKEKEAELQKAAQLAAAKKTTKTNAATGFDRAAGMHFIVPINYRVIARRLQRDHFGIDYDAPVGTPVKAAQDGKVIQITGGWAGGFGNSILVDHGGGVTTRYAHLSKIGVSVGETVDQGALIGWSGNTGFSTGPHLHFETRVNGKAVDPFL